MLHTSDHFLEGFVDTSSLGAIVEGVRRPVQSASTYACTTVAGFILRAVKRRQGRYKRLLGDLLLRRRHSTNAASLPDPRGCRTEAIRTSHVQS